MAAAALEARCRFLEQPRWKALFQRNKRPNGLKNLRCFPTCGPKHDEHTFCGAGIHVLISTSPHREALECIGELCVASSPPRFGIGQIVAVKDVRAITRSLKDASQPLVASSTADGSTFAFLPEGTGWHYQWVGSRHTADTLHAFRVFVMAPVPNDATKRQIIATFLSPRFAIYSQRRRDVVSNEQRAALALPPPPSDLLCVTPGLQSNGSVPALTEPQQQVSNKRARVEQDDVMVQREARLRRVLSAVATLDQLGNAVPSFDDIGLDMGSVLEVFDEAELFTEAEDVYGDVDLFNSDVELDQTRVEAVEMITALAQYLLKERQLTQSLQSTRDQSISFSAFLEVIEKDINAFLASRFDGVTIETLDAMLHGNKPLIPSLQQAYHSLAAKSDAPLPPFASPVLEPASMSPGGTLEGLLADFLPFGVTFADLLAEPKPFDPHNVMPDVSGVWVRPAESTQDLDDMRQRRNIDVMQRVLFAQMEKRMALSVVSPGVLKVQLEPKLLSSGEILFRLDGKIYPFSVGSPLGGTNPIGRTLQSWVVGNVLMLRMCFDEQGRYRHVRAHWKHNARCVRCVHWYEELGEAKIMRQDECVLRFGDWLVGHVVHFEMSPPEQDE